MTLIFGNFVGALALRQPVLHTAFKFAPAAITLMGNGAGDHVVQKRAVMADQKNRAVKVLQQVFEQLQRVDIKVIGRLIQHQHVGGSGKQARQQQPVALTTAQGAHWRVGARWREQKVTQVTFDVLFAVANLDPLAPRADEVFQGGIKVERVAHLVKISHGDVGPLAHRAPGAFARAGLG